MGAMLLKVLAGALIGAVVGWRLAKGRGTAEGARQGLGYGALAGLLVHVVAGTGGAYLPPTHLRVVPESEFQGVIASAGRPVVIDFFATWCGPCRRLMPQVDALAAEMGDRVLFIAVDVDQSPGVAGRYRVEGVPTLVFLTAEGREADRTVGLLGAAALRERVQRLQGEAAGSSRPAGPAF